jgi:hypothetical protein
VIDSVIGRHRRDIERINTLQATHIEAVLLWIRTPLVVCMDSAIGAKVMLRSPRIKLIELQEVLTLNYSYSRQWNRGDDGALSSAHRTVTSSRIYDAIRQIKLQHD